MLDPTDFNCLCYALALCHSFKGCALPPSLPFHAHFLSSIPAHNVASTIFWRDNQKIAGLGRDISNPLILPSTGHAEDLGDAQLHSGGPRSQPALTCLRIWSSKGCHTLTCLGIRQSRGPRRSSCLDLPRDPIPGRPSYLDLPRDSISRRLSRFSLPGELHPDPGMPGSQVATVLGRIIFRKTRP